MVYSFCKMKVQNIPNTANLRFNYLDTTSSAQFNDNSNSFQFRDNNQANTNEWVLWGALFGGLLGGVAGYFDISNRIKKTLEKSPKLIQLAGRLGFASLKGIMSASILCGIIVIAKALFDKLFKPNAHKQ